PLIRYATEGGWTHLSPDESLIDRWFLLYVLRANRLARAKADGYPVLNLTEIKALQVPLPPLPEQRAIAQVLRTVQRAKEATERVIAAARELKKSLMRHLFTYGPVPLDQVDGVRLKETEIGPLPEGWEVVEIGDVASMKQGRVLPTNKFSDSGYPVFGASCKVPLPPLPEQQKIAQMLRTVDRKIQAEERRKAALDGLFRTLLHHLMTGKVRVAQWFVNQFKEEKEG
ncbi:MAG: restriction endonuclease subunit S, partial [Anaerolineae bacterium]